MVAGDQVDRWNVAGDAVDGAMQAVVQRVDVAAGQSASGGVNSSRIPSTGTVIRIDGHPGWRSPMSSGLLRLLMV